MMAIMAKNDPIIHAKKQVAKSKLFTVESVELEFSNGVQVEFERLANASYGAVLIVPIENKELILIREYGCGAERYELGFPKGKIDKGEDWRQAALREGQEEIGLKASALTHLGTVTMAPGYMTHQIEVILAKGFEPNKLVGDEPEPLEVIRWPLSDWKNLIAHAEFTEGRGYAALMLALQAEGVI